MTVPELTEAMIAAAMAKADARVCVPGDTRCYAGTHSPVGGASDLHHEGAL